MPPLDDEYASGADAAPPPATADGGPSTAPDANKSASRIFAGPGQYPPEQFAAYGILAFRTIPISDDLRRSMAICEAYIGTIPHEAVLGNISRNEQVVTVWPIADDQTADDLNKRRVSEVCAAALSDYGIALAKSAIDAARDAGLDVGGRGPFLIAWSPGSNKLAPGTPALFCDLSNATVYEHARYLVNKWVVDIEHNPDLWPSDNKMELRVRIRLFVDRYGSAILETFGKG